LSFFKDPALALHHQETADSSGQAIAEQTQEETAAPGIQEDLETVEQQTQLFVVLGTHGPVLLGIQELVILGTPAHAANGAQEQTFVRFGIQETIFVQTTFFRQETAQQTTLLLIFVTLQPGISLALPVTALTLAIALTGQHLLLDARPATPNTLDYSSL
jgi:hypothetical protein